MCFIELLIAILALGILSGTFIFTINKWTTEATNKQTAKAAGLSTISEQTAILVSVGRKTDDEKNKIYVIEALQPETEAKIAFETKELMVNIINSTVENGNQQRATVTFKYLPANIFDDKNKHILVEAGYYDTKINVPIEQADKLTALTQNESGGDDRVIPFFMPIIMRSSYR